MFYMLAFLLLVIDLVKLILSFQWFLNQDVVFFLYGQTLKFLIGVEQVWINVELIFSIKYSIDAMNKATATFPVRKVKIGRIAVLTFIILYGTITLIRFLVAQMTFEDDERYDYNKQMLHYYVPVM